LHLIQGPLGGDLKSKDLWDVSLTIMSWPEMGIGLKEEMGKGRSKKRPINGVMGT
jgi:hypothetical protein